MKQHVVIGTAGHIDHGKTSLVKALTNMDTDRLEEEKARGMTIDLGFAYFGANATIIDVPGHEKFIRNMVAGVSTIDLVLLVIAADDGIMPQTIEHLEILNLLQIRQGIVVLSKIDMVDPEWLELVEAEIRDLLHGTFLEKAPILRVSNLSGAGIPDLSAAISKMITQIPPRTDRGLFRLPIDRVFTMKGFGTVVAGTVLSGQLAVEQTVELLPARRQYRVRGIQMHGLPVTRVAPGDRAAINLAGIEKEDAQRGDVLAETGAFAPAFHFDIKLYLLKSAPAALKQNSRVRLHIGTSEVMARVRLLDTDALKPGETGFAQFQCEGPIIAENQDRFVIRRYSPMVTIGGGVILQSNSPRHKRFDAETLAQLKILETGDIFDLIEQAALKGPVYHKSIDDLSKLTGIPPSELPEKLAELVARKKITEIRRKNQLFYLHHSLRQYVGREILALLEQFHRENPLKQGMTPVEIHSTLDLKTELFVIQAILKEFETESQIIFVQDKVRATNYQITLTPEQTRVKIEMEQYFIKQEFSPPDTAEIIAQFKTRFPDVEKIIAYLLEQKILIYIEDGLLLHHQFVAKARTLIQTYFSRQRELKMSDFRDMIQASRKYALPLLNYFDQHGLTIRQDDVRILNE